MAQMTIFDKQRHFSNKDVTISVGKHSVVYVTFRNNSWTRITSNDFMCVSVENGKIKFFDGNALKGKRYKLKQNKSTPCRYMQITQFPEVLEIAERTAGSYDLPELPRETRDDLTFKTKEDYIIKMTPDDCTIKKRIAVPYYFCTLADFNKTVTEWALLCNTEAERVEMWRTVASVFGHGATSEPKKENTKQTTAAEPDKWAI